MNLQSVWKSAVLRALFYPAPSIYISKEEEADFETLYDEVCSSGQNSVDYRLKAPKYKFLEYLLRSKPVVLHGSNRPGIEQFEPRQQTLFDGKMTTSVFASKDAIWPIFYAVLRREQVVGNFRNGCLRAGDSNKYHYYSLSTPTFNNNPWTNGVIYVLPSEGFIQSDAGMIQFDEWTCDEPVAPLFKLAVSPADFYFLNKVAKHRAEESLAKTWMLYKVRSVLRPSSFASLD
ncbi:hypothetical protein EBB07_34105 [Paenibacillaceae bacterium]|nr:hypothetical protein EBB07_34105 [Paenibacillaceae bacterium]